VNVRRASPADLETVIALRVALLREYQEHPVYGRLRTDAEARARPAFAAQLDSPAEAIFLAEENREAIGILRCVDVIGAPMLMPDRYCYVSSVYVKPAHRHRGVLRSMLETAERWCHERGLTEMRLHNVDTSDSAVGAWDALGFAVVEQVRLLRLDTALHGANSGSGTPAARHSSAPT
jgi:ribosomal protein S18 acetylase RimI-like enzyme